MDQLDEVFPSNLNYSPPGKAVVSTRRTVKIKPLSGSKISTASSSDIVQFRMPSTGVLDSCYLVYDLKPTLDTSDTTGTGAVASNKVLLDKFAPDAGVVRQVTIKSSDGTNVSQQNNYNSWCSMMARLEGDTDKSENERSIGQKCPYNGQEQAQEEGRFRVGADIADFTATNTLVGQKFAEIKQYQRYDEQNKRMSQAFATTDEKQICHHFRDNALDNKLNLGLPLFALGSGLTVELQLEDKNNVFHGVATAMVKTDANAQHLQSEQKPGEDLVTSYEVNNVALVCDLIHYDAQTMANISEKLCDGLKMQIPSVKNQIQAISAQSQNIQLSVHGRSVDAVFFGLKNQHDNNAVAHDKANWYNKPDSTNQINEYQAQVGSESTPSFIVSGMNKGSAEAFEELKKAYYGGYGQRLSCAFNADEYNLARRATGAIGVNEGTPVQGSAIYGISLKSHPRLNDNVLSGKTASSGAIGISVDLTFSGSPSNTQAEFFIKSSTVIEWLGDGGCLVSK